MSRPAPRRLRRAAAPFGDDRRDRGGRVRAKPGAVIGPVKTEKGFNLFKVAAMHKPAFAEVKEDLRAILFRGFLDKLRSKATVEHTALDATA